MKLFKPTVLLLFILGFLMGANYSNIYAQDETGTKDLLELDLEALLNMEVTTASKKAEKTTDAPGIISTITSQEIKNLGATNIYDILEMAPSVQPLSSHLFVRNKAAIRGELNTHADNHVLVLLNGRPIREGVSGGANSPVYEGFPVELIDRIEIIRGPGSVLYGTNAYLGVINIITKKPGDENSIKLSGGTGSFGTAMASATGSYQSEDFSAVVGAKLLNQEGWDFDMITKRPGAPDRPVSMKYGQKNLALYSDLNYKGFNLQGLYIDNNQDALGLLPYGIFAGTNKFSRLFFNLGYTNKLSENWEATANLNYDGSDYTLSDDAIAAPDHHSSTDYLGEVTVFGALSDNFNLTFGGSVYLRNKNKREGTDVVPEYHQTHLSVYTQADYRPVDNLKLIVGAQLNKPDEGDADIVPRFGAIWEFYENFGLKALYAQAFRSPWPLEQLIENPVLIGNPVLGPEKIATTDIQLFFAGKKAEASITYYTSHYTDLIIRVPYTTGGLTFANGGSMDFSGIEFTGKASLTSSLFLTGSAAVNNPEKDASALPKFMAKIGVFYTVGSGLTLGLHNAYYGKPEANSAPEVNPVAEAVDLLDANIIYRLPISLPLELSVTVKNLLNSEYNFTEYARNWVNTFPAGPGTAIYGKVSLSL